MPNKFNLFLAFNLKRTCVIQPPVIVFERIQCHANTSSVDFLYKLSFNISLVKRRPAEKNHVNV